MARLNLIDLDRAAYEPTLRLQEALLERVKAAPRDEDLGYLVMVEHDPPVITLGRRAKESNIVVPREFLDSQGIELFESRRGGDVTYHGPGQLVGYPIVRVDQRGRSVHGHLRALEEAIIRLLRRYDLPAGRVDGLTGVWVDGRKVAAIGIAVSRWVAWHGFALNIQPDLCHFQLIIPCGISDKPVTSVAELLGRDVSVAEVQPALIECLAEVLGFDGVHPVEDEEFAPLP